MVHPTEACLLVFIINVFDPSPISGSFIKDPLDIVLLVICVKFDIANDAPIAVTIV